MRKTETVYVAGHRGLVGSAIVRELSRQGYSNLVLPAKSELDLLNQAQTLEFFDRVKIDSVFVAAAKVGGIHANSTYPADFLYENLMIACNVIHAAAQKNVKKLLFLGSSCIYPRLAPQPIEETSLLAGPLEPTNDAYAIAKIAGLKLCEKYSKQYGKRFVSAMPCNLYGPGDNFHPENSHVIPGMMRRFHKAKLDGDSDVSVWGSGTPRREFLHVDDLAAALVLLMEHYEAPETINVGTGEDVTIAELAALIKGCTEFQGQIRFDSSKPDGTPRKVLNVERIRKLGWAPRISLREGLGSTYQWALENRAL